MKPSVLAVFLLLTCAGMAKADSRDEAMNAIVNLKLRGDIVRNRDELNSIESTFSAAEQHRQQNSTEMSERLYLLTIQKVRILLVESRSRTETSTPPGPPNTDNTVSPDNAAIAPETGKPPEAPRDTRSGTDIPPAAAKSEMAGETGSEHEFPASTIESASIIGQPSLYTVVKRDSLRLVAAKLGVSRQHLARMNNLGLKTTLKVGQKLKYNNRKIVPRQLANGIIINIPDRTLYYFRNGKLALSLPVAVGVPKKGAKYDWTTPTGKFRITSKVKDPTWYVPRSIRAKMEEDGKEIVSSMPPGPGNPLGKYAIKTSMPGILIHSTTRPGSIYSYASHGCIRVYPEQMESFFNQIRVNTPGEIIYKPVKLAVDEEGRVLLEVHDDAYGKSGGLHSVARQLIEKSNLGNRVDWDKVEAVIAHKAGFAEDVTL